MKLLILLFLTFSAFANYIPQTKVNVEIKVFYGVIKL